MASISQIKAFWDGRAREYGHDWRATLGERYLRMLEIKTMKRYLSELNPRLVYDIGCGNGFSTLAYARHLPAVSFVGIDYSGEMIRVASGNACANCTFIVGDVLAPRSLPITRPDVIITQRCIQNLPDYDHQRLAIQNMRMRLQRDGTLLMMEGSKPGIIGVNKVRRICFKSEIVDAEPWHNCFLWDKRMVEDFGARVVHFSSTYMFLSRVLHWRLSWVGYRLPNVGHFGYEKLYIVKGLD